MLTHSQLLWLNDGEKTAMENWYASGNRGRPWAKVIAFDSKRYVRIGEAARADLEKKPSEAVLPLQALMHSDVSFLCYVGMTALPASGPRWLTQNEISEGVLDGSLKAEDVSKALFTVAGEGEDHLYVVVNKYRENEQTSKLKWAKPVFAAIPVQSLRNDPTMVDFSAALMAATTMETAVDTLTEQFISTRGDMPRELVQAGVARSAVKDMAENGFQITMRKDRSLTLVMADLEKLGAQFYGETNA